VNSQQKQMPAKRPEVNIHGLDKEISDAVCQDNSFALDAGRKLYRYQNSVYPIRHGNANRCHRIIWSTSEGRD
jgi:hypothetical protein